MADEEKAALKKAAGVSGGKEDECQVRLERTQLLDGHRDWHARRLWVSGPSRGR